MSYSRRNFDSTVIGQMLISISNQRAIDDVLIFGCGTGCLPVILNRFYPQAKITAYDNDTSKIEEMKKREWLANINYTSINYTAQKPAAQFGLILASHVLHHAPLQIAQEIIGLTKPGGLVGVADYAMKNYSRDDFLSRWGKTKDEQVELEKFGPEEAYKLHTSFSLEDCCTLMRANKILQLDGKERIPSLFGEEFPPNFYYVGIKPKLF